jgi:hypothetical protein
MFVNHGPAKHVTVIKAYSKALAALTRLGLCEPPTPSPFIALHIPGAQNAHVPTTRIWKSVLRKKEDLEFRAVKLGSSPSSSFATCDPSLRGWDNAAILTK